MNEEKIIELFDKYKDLRTKEPIEEAMTLHSFKKAMEEAVNYKHTFEVDLNSEKMQKEYNKQNN